MSTPDRSAGTAADAATPAIPAASVAAGAIELVDASDTPDLPKVRGGWATALVFAVFGSYLAWITPIAISLAIRVNELAPGQEQWLGILLSIGSLAAVLVGPLGGQLSDRTRSRLGRRRPWIIGGTIVGVLGLTIMGLAPSILVLGMGWVVAQIGWSQVVAALTTLMADKLPEQQRGKISGMTGVVTGLAPVFGAVIGGAVSGQPLLLMLVPAAIGVIALVPIMLVAREADSRGLVVESKLTVGTMLANYVFSPKQYPDFGWNWLGRVHFFFGLTLSTTYTAFFFAERLDIPVADIGGTVATVGMIGIIGTVIGAIVSGGLSDKLGRRKPFILGAGIMFALGCVVIVFAPDLPILIAGTFLTNLAIGVFSAVDQALMLDVLPEKEHNAGRFINIFGFASTLPQAFAPVVASGLLLIGATDGSKNYVIVYLAAGLLTIVGGAMILRIKKVR